MNTNDILQRATDFIWRNARLLDRQRFAHLFLRGEREPVLAALRAYQNVDGGFGNALEPDIRCPLSQSVPVELALRVLDECAAPDDALVARACDYLVSISSEDGGVPWVLPSVQEYPRAPWWEPEEGLPASLNPTAAIAGLLHKRGGRHPWLEGATAFCWREIARKPVAEPHAMLCALTFLEHVPERERAEAAFEQLGKALLSGGLVALDPQAEGYVKSPLDYAPEPDSLARRLFDDATIDAHLDALAARQQHDGGWPISWQPPSDAAVVEWRGHITIEALKTLRAYGRLG
jgi:hypothetical protein